MAYYLEIFDFVNALSKLRSPFSSFMDKKRAEPEGIRSHFRPWPVFCPCDGNGMEWNGLRNEMNCSYCRRRRPPGEDDACPERSRTRRSAECAGDSLREEPASASRDRMGGRARQAPGQSRRTEIAARDGVDRWRAGRHRMGQRVRPVHVLRSPRRAPPGAEASATMARRARAARSTSR